MQEMRQTKFVESVRSKAVYEEVLKAMAKTKDSDSKWFVDLANFTLDKLK